MIYICRRYTKALSGTGNGIACHCDCFHHWAPLSPPDLLHQVFSIKDTLLSSVYITWRSQSLPSIQVGQFYLVSYMWQLKSVMWQYHLLCGIPNRLSYTSMWQTKPYNFYLLFVYSELDREHVYDTPDSKCARSNQPLVITFVNSRESLFLSHTSQRKCWVMLSFSCVKVPNYLTFWSGG